MIPVNFTQVTTEAPIYFFPDRTVVYQASDGQTTIVVDGIAYQVTDALADVLVAFGELDG